MPKDVAGQTQALRLLTDAARRAGCRAIVQSPSAQACGFASNERILYVAAAPHHAIFPRCCAIVHHGGAGTTQSAALAGKPSVVVANLAEQQHWGNELHRLGIGAKPVKRRNVTPGRLAERMLHVLAAPAMADEARAIGAAMRQENGVAEAVELVMARFGAVAATGQVESVS
jgi:UDP:flavonoid glycosyltransferase YjiC (YdhE family)